MAEIFLSYRRDDSTSATGRLADALEAHFGDDRVFRDREIGAGENFVEAIRRSVESSTVVLVVVGRRWLGALDAAGRRRLDDPADFVRLEIELALAAGVAVVPVLVEGATMPSAADLPASLAAFSRCQAVELSDTRWRYDADRLIEMLHARYAIESDRAPLDAAGAVAPMTGVTRWGVDLLDLARHPRRLIARRQTGRAGDHVRAFVFLCVAILLGHLVLLAGIDVELIARGTIGEKAVGVVAWMLTGLMIDLLLAGLLTAALALAWRVVDRGAGYRRVGLVFAYIFGGVWLGFCVGMLVVVTAIQLIDAGWLQRGLAGLHASMAASTPLPAPSMERLDTAPMRGGAAILLVLGALIWLATAAWGVVAWGAFRQSFAAARWQSWLATSIWIALLAAIVWLPLQLV